MTATSASTAAEQDHPFGNEALPRARGGTRALDPALRKADGRPPKRNAAMSSASHRMTTRIAARPGV